MKIGKISENVQKRSILRLLKTGQNEVLVGAGPGEDCAVFAFPGERLVTCLVEGLGSVSQLLTEGVNRLLIKGAVPVSVSLHIVLPPEAEEESLKECVAAARDFCEEEGILLTQVTGRVNPVMSDRMVVASFTGSVSGDAATFYDVKQTKPFQDIIVTKWIGMRGSAYLAEKHYDEILERYPKWVPDAARRFEDCLSVRSEAAVAIKSGVCTMLNVSEGGILAALWELAEGAGVGLTIDLKKLPIRQETVEICNYLNVNPYEMLSGGCLLMTAADGALLTDALTAEGIPAVVVGRTTDGKDRLIVNDEEVRFLDRPHSDSLFDRYFV